MVNPGTFRGLRKEFLMGEKAAYTSGIASGYAKDALAIIQRRYFKRFPVELPLEEEPTAEHLAAVNDEDPDPEQVPPNEDELSPEEYAGAVQRLKDRQKLIELRRGQVKRWLAYQYMKDNDIDPKDSGAQNPYRILLQKLTGKGLQRPRHKAAANVWRKTHLQEIEERTKAQATVSGVNMRKLAPIRERVAKEMFEKLDEDERAEWAETAKEEHEEALRKWEADAKGPLSTSAEDRQRCILGLTQFVQPILDLICEATGWKASFITGGPEPAFSGRLNMLSVHSGTISGDVKMNFGRCEQVRYQKHIVPIYGDFLRKCYSLDECRACALNNNSEAFECVADLEHPTNVNVDAIPLSTEARMLSEPAISPPRPLEAPSSTQKESQPTVSARPCGPSPVFEGQVTSNPPVSTHLPDSPSRPPPPPPARSHVASPCPSPQPSPPASPCHRSSQGHASLDATHTVHEQPSDPPQSAEAAPQREPSALAPNSALLAVAHVSAPASTSSHLQQVASKKRQHRGANVPDDAVDTDTAIPLSKCTRKGALKDDHGPSTPAAVMAAPTTLKRTRKGGLMRDTSSSSSGPGPAFPPLVDQTAQEPIDSSTSEVPDSNGKDWFDKSLLQFEWEPFGGEWTRLLQEWTAFQVEAGYTHTGKLSAKGQPESVTMWIGRGRSPIWRPSERNPKPFERQFNTWWGSIQPKWRVSGGKVVKTSVGNDWGCLRLPGVNGIQSVVAALFFWGLAASRKAAARKVWVAAVEDCIHVLSQLRLTPTPLP